MTKFLVLFGALAFGVSAALAQTYSIKIYGAVGDGKTLATKAVQQAVDACAVAGGGTVEVPAGTYVIGTVFLKSHVELHLGSGAVLKGSSSLADYHSYTMPEYGQNYYGMLFTENAEDVAITGEGTVDGNNAVFYDFTQAKALDTATTRYTRQRNNYRHVASGIGDGPVVPLDRPRQMVVFSVCKNVRVSNVSLINSPFWTLHFADCTGVAVRGVRLYSGLLVPNADGIDFTDCQNVTVSDCDIQAGDDALVVSGYNHHFEIPGFHHLRRVSENITITNCNLQSASSGIRIGYLDQNTVRNVTVSNCNITNSTRGINISLRDEGSLENLIFSNIRIETRLRTGDWWGNGEPIHLSAIRGNADKSVPMGRIRNVQFNNITCRGENGILVYGTAESPLEDVTFNNVRFDFVDSPLNAVAGGNVDLRGNLDPQYGLFARDIPGLLAEHVQGLTIRDFTLNWVNAQAMFLSNGIEVNQSSGVKITGFTGTGAPTNRRARPVQLGLGVR